MMRKNKFAFILIAFVLACLMTFHASAIGGVEKYEFGNVTVIFDENTKLNDIEKNAIANHLVYGNTDDSSTYGLWCSLFGHSYESHMASKITHCVYDTNPRCVEETYEVLVCTRCEDTVSTKIATAEISCCPEE